jgi:DNA replication protein DnaC
MSRCPLYDRCNHKDCDKDFCIRRFKVEKLYDYARIPDSKRPHLVLHVDPNGTDLAEFQKLAEIEKNIEQFVKEGRNIYLHSPYCGNGKTSWALRLIKAYINAIWPKATLECKALFINVPKFLLDLKDEIGRNAKDPILDELRKDIDEADIVVWDDVGTKPGSEYELNQLLSRIDKRAYNRKSNIFTTNLNPEQLDSLVGSRLKSRICNASEDIELHGSDKRSWDVGE